MAYDPAIDFLDVADRMWPILGRLRTRSRLPGHWRPHRRPCSGVATRAPAEDAAASSDAVRLRVSRTAGDPPRFPLADLQTRRDLGSSPVGRAELRLRSCGRGPAAQLTDAVDRCGSPAHIAPRALAAAGDSPGCRRTPRWSSCRGRSPSARLTSV